MLTIRTIAPAIRKVENIVKVNVKSLSTKLRIFDTEKVVKYVHVPKPTPAQKLTGNTDPKEGNVDYVPNPKGRLFQAVLHKGREGKTIGLNDLRKVILQCEKVEDVRYATKLVEQMEKRAYDFSEDINTCYVNMCIKFDRLDVIISDFSVFRLRMGAWTTAESFERFILATEAKGETAAALPVLHMLAKKGVEMTPSSVDLLVKAAAASCDAKVYGLTIFSATTVLGDEAAKEMAAAHPLQVAVEPVVEAEVTEGEGGAVEEGSEAPTADK